jgi:cytochrome c oxidase subunit I
MRAPGLTMWRMPIFTWNTLITAILILMAFPPLAAALFALGADRKFGANIFDPENGGPILWQHLFWFFGHPEVYIIALPFFGMVSEIFPVFSRKPIFGYKGIVYATISIGALSVTVWAHHMYVTGSVLLPFFAFMTMLIAVPTGVKFFNWIGTMWGGSMTFETPMLWSLGFMVTFLFGGLTGIILSSPPLNFHVSDTYFVVAHFHYTVFGTVVFAMFAGVYFWWPKWTGKMLKRAPGQDPLLDAIPWLPRHLPDPALARCRGHAPPLRGLYAAGQLCLDEPVLHRLVLPAGRLDDPVLLKHLHHLAQRGESGSR